MVRVDKQHRAVYNNSHYDSSLYRLHIVYVTQMIRKELTNYLDSVTVNLATRRGHRSVEQNSPRYSE